VLPRPLPVLTAPAVVPTAGAAAGRVGLATERAAGSVVRDRSGRSWIADVVTGAQRRDNLSNPSSRQPMTGFVPVLAVKRR